VRISPSIRINFRKKPIQIISEIHAGFDTEYQSIKIGENKLLSTQFSTTGLIKLFIPKTKDYEFQGVHTLSGELYYKTDNLPDTMDSKELKRLINEYIKIIRVISHQNYDNLMSKLTKKIKQYKDKYNEIIITKSSLNFKNDGTIFQFNYLPIKQRIIINENKEKLKISMVQLVNEIKSTIEKDLNKKSIDILEIIKDKISEDCLELLKDDEESKNQVGEGFKLSDIKDPLKSEENLLEAIDKNTIKYNDDGFKIDESNKTDESNNNIEEVKKPKILKINTIPSFYTNEDSIKVYYKERLVLVGHYNAADLSLLSD
jgi:hypothetical protein